jgi:hypothetical protein
MDIWIEFNWVSQYIYIYIYNNWIINNNNNYYYYNLPKTDLESSTNGSSWLDVNVGHRRLIHIQLHIFTYIFFFSYLDFRLLNIDSPNWHSHITSHKSYCTYIALGELIQLNEAHKLHREELIYTKLPSIGPYIHGNWSMTSINIKTDILDNRISQSDYRLVLSCACLISFTLKHFSRQLLCLRWTFILILYFNSRG